MTLGHDYSQLCVDKKVDKTILLGDACCREMVIFKAIVEVWKKSSTK